MPTTSLLTGQEAFWLVTAAGADGSAKPASCNAKVAPYGGGFVTLKGANEIHFVALTPGNYTVTVTGLSADATPLTPDVQSFVVTAPPVPQATHFIDGTISVKNSDFTTPGNPGVDNISFSV